MEKVLVTGITGYIGQHCAAELLRQGYAVVGTIRSRSKADDTRTALARVAPTSNLNFEEADLLSDRGWDQAMKGCTFALNIASPFSLAEPIEMATLAGVLRNAGYKRVPSLKAPTILLKLMGLIDPEAKGMLPFIGKKVVLDNSDTLTVLNWTPSPMPQAFIEMAAALS
jgi:hypothetical protein